MASYILDTHPIVWYFEASPLLSKKVKDLLAHSNETFVIPSIVICELIFLARKERFAFDVSAFRNLIEEDRRFSVYPLDETISFGLLPDLEMHDAIIVGTAQRVLSTGETVSIISKDRQIAARSPCPVVWK